MGRLQRLDAIQVEPSFSASLKKTKGGSARRLTYSTPWPVIVTECAISGQIPVTLKLLGQFIVYSYLILRYCGCIEQLLKCTTIVANTSEYQQLEQLR